MSNRFFAPALAIVSALWAGAGMARGQAAPLPITGYAETFDFMTSTGTSPPAGWSVWTLPGGATTFISSIPPSAVAGGAQVTPPGSLGVFTQSGVSRPAANNAGYNFAFSATAQDRALGAAPTGVAAGALQLTLSNQTGAALERVNVAFVLRVMADWAGGELPGVRVFVSANQGAYASVPALDVVVASTDATGAAYSRSAFVTLPAIVPPGGELSFRFVDDNADAISPDQPYAIDSVIVIPAPSTLGACCVPATGACAVTSLFACNPGVWSAGACDPEQCFQRGPTRFAVVGDYGVDNANQAGVASRIATFAPEFIATTGDNTYFTNADISNWDNTQAKYYAPFIKLPPGSAYLAQGSPVNRFFPVMGNHDMDVGGSVPAALASWNAYWDLPGNERTYTITRGSVQLFMLSSDTREPESALVGGNQFNWFIDQLAQSTSPFKFVFFHHPAYTYPTNHAPATWMQAWSFETRGVSGVFSGHNHNLQRIELGGIPWYVNGAGGQSLYAVSGTTSGGAFVNATSFGFQIVDAWPDRVVVRLVDSGGTVLDSRTINTPSGACCVGTTCTLTVLAGCSGTFKGAGSACGTPANPLACCPANINGVNGVSTQDLFDFLGLWFTADPRGDFNGVDGVSIQDLFDFLAAWFVGC